MFHHKCALWNQTTKEDFFGRNFQKSLKQNKRTARSSKKKLLLEEEIISNCSITKKADKYPIPSYTLKSSKLKGKRLSTFRKKKAIGTIELTRLEYLKVLLKSKIKIVTGQCIFVDTCVDSESLLTGPNCTACKECDLPIPIKCAIANDLLLWLHAWWRNDKRRLLI